MGGGKKSKAPPAPDYSGLAAQDAKAQKATAELITQQNRPTQNNPFGQMNWSKDAAGNWTQQELWDPRIMQGYDRAFDMKNNAMKDAQNAKFQGPGKLEDFQASNTGIKTDLAKDFDPNASGKAASDAMYQSYMSRAGKEQGDAQAAMQTQLRQQGLQPGTAAYDRAYQNLLTSQGDVNTKANLDSIVLGGNEARQNYQSMLSGKQQNFGQNLSKAQFDAAKAQQDYQMKMAGQNQQYSQADADYTRAWDTAGAANNLLNTQYRPTFTGFSGATGYNPADMSGAAQAQYNAKMGGYNAQQAKKGNTMNTAGTLGSAAMM